MLKFAFATLAAIVILGGAAKAQTCSAYPYTLANGSTADANQVMANFNCAARTGSPAFTGFVGVGTTAPLSPLSVSGQVVIGTPYRGDASLQILGSYGGFGRLTQMSPSVPSAGALNLMASTDSNGNDQWWAWGVNNGVWTINRGAAWGQDFSINGSGYVGIGTTAPWTTLTVVGASAPYIGNNNDGIAQIVSGNDRLEQGIVQGSYAWLQTVSPGQSIRNLVLNPGGGNVGVGVTNPTAALQVDGYGVCASGFRTAFVGNGGASFDMLQGGDNNLYFCYGGNAVIQIDGYGAYHQISDGRLKTNIAAMSDGGGLNAINRLRPVAYSFRRDKNRAKHYGFIAQEVERVFPELVSTMAAPTSDGAAQISDAKSVDYTGLIAPLVKAVQQLKAINDVEEQEIQALKAQVAALKSGR